MSDKEVVSRISEMVPGATFHFDGDDCVTAKLTDKKNIYFGLIRQYSQAEKNEVLGLISKLENLKCLDLRKNKLFYIPKMNFRNLEHLDLASNYLGDVPEWIKNNNLLFVNLGVNEITKLPGWFDRYVDVEVLKLHKNKIKDFQPIKQCSKVKFLNLYFNGSKSIPNFIWDFKDIRFFSWGVSGITSVSDNVSNWTNLEHLSLVANKIKILPDSICKITSLKSLRVHKNHLECLPNDIGNLCNLEQLTLYKNRITSLPESFKNLKLKKLNVACNGLNSFKDINSDWACFNEKDCGWED